ncbi:MAG: thioredoxin family protein [Bacteroidia bacterium]|nr:thioredoxin family protein [Bacteroidia bacterium]
MSDKIDLDYVKQAGRSYESYQDLIDGLLAQGKTTGTDQGIHRLKHAPLNRQRIKRLDKTARLHPEFTALLRQIPYKPGFLVLTEGWCGDAAQMLPYIHLMALATKEVADEYYLLRDVHPDLMNRFLSNGARAIPKLVVFNARDGQILFTWGPRPESIQTWYLDMKKSGQYTKEEGNRMLHQRYTSDKGKSFQDDLTVLFRNSFLPH